MGGELFESERAKQLHSTGHGISEGLQNESSALFVQIDHRGSHHPLGPTIDPRCARDRRLGAGEHERSEVPIGKDGEGETPHFGVPKSSQTIQ